MGREGAEDEGCWGSRSRNGVAGGSAAAEAGVGYCCCSGTEGDEEREGCCSGLEAPSPSWPAHVSIDHGRPARGVKCGSEIERVQRVYIGPTPLGSPTFGYFRWAEPQRLEACAPYTFFALHIFPPGAPRIGTTLPNRSNQVHRARLIRSGICMCLSDAIRVDPNSCVPLTRRSICCYSNFWIRAIQLLVHRERERDDSILPMTTSDDEEEGEQETTSPPIERYLSLRSRTIAIPSPRTSPRASPPPPPPPPQRSPPRAPRPSPTVAHSTSKGKGEAAPSATAAMTAAAATGRASTPSTRGASPLRPGPATPPRRAHAHGVLPRTLQVEEEEEEKEEEEQEEERGLLRSCRPLVPSTRPRHRPQKHPPLDGPLVRRSTLALLLLGVATLFLVLLPSPTALVWRTVGSRLWGQTRSVPSHPPETPSASSLLTRWKARKTAPLTTDDGTRHDTAAQSPARGQQELAGGGDAQVRWEK
jgi:hypothetical protein